MREQPEKEQIAGGHLWPRDKDIFTANNAYPESYGT